MNPTLCFGYGTNGFGDHTLDEALAVIGDLGYEGVAITLDRRHLDPFADDLAERLTRLRHRLGRLGLSAVIETGGRYLLDPWHKHQPTLISNADAERRVDLLIRAIRIAAELNAEVMSFWSGALEPGADEAVAWDRLATGCEAVLKEADVRGVALGFEPEPGMFVDTLARYDRLRRLLGEPPEFALTLDLGHCRCIEPWPVTECVRRYAQLLTHVQLADMRRGVHEHLEMGEGEIDFGPVLAALADCGYGGLVSVELPRHSHAAPEVARRSMDSLLAAVP